jgi:hypothetical protein
MILLWPLEDPGGRRGAIGRVGGAG